MKCSKCGYIVLADTDEWKNPLCYDCWHEIGKPAVEPTEKK